MKHSCSTDSHLDFPGIKTLKGKFVTPHIDSHCGEESK